MENATKALLIAAAVLVAIIIISITLSVVRQGQDAVQNVDMTEAELLALNSKFTGYEGDNVSASTVNTLLNVIVSHNQQAEAGYEVSVKSSGDGKVALNTDKKSIKTQAKASYRYSVACTMKSGVVTEIVITPNV